MEDLTAKIPLFKKIDKAVFDRLDKFKLTPNYTQLQDMYGSLEEEQQKVAKGVGILALLIFPFAFLSLLWWQNSRLKDDFELRRQIVSKANEILGQKQGLQEVKFNVISGNPIDSESMMTSRLGNMLGGQGMDLSKIQVRDFNTSNVSSEVLRSEASLSFTNLGTEELMNLFIAMIQRDKFRISEVHITRNADSNLLNGKFHAIHFSALESGGGEE